MLQLARDSSKILRLDACSNALSQPLNHTGLGRKKQHAFGYSTEIHQMHLCIQANIQPAKKGTWPCSKS